MRTSSALRLGEIYTRADLRTTFNITAASLNNGIFHPAGQESVWLFVTKEKTRDRTPYRDQLSGQALEMDGQKLARTDSLIIDHRSKDFELLLFYRNKRGEYPHAGFRYLGRAEYVSHEKGAREGEPTHFTLRLIDPVPSSTA